MTLCTPGWIDGVKTKRSNPLRLVDVRLGHGLFMAKKLSDLLSGADDAEQKHSVAPISYMLLCASILHTLATAPTGVERYLDDVAARFVITPAEGDLIYNAMLASNMAAHPDIVAYINMAGRHMLCIWRAGREDAQLAALGYVIEYAPSGF